MRASINSPENVITSGAQSLKKIVLKTLKDDVPSCLHRISNKENILFLSKLRPFLQKDLVLVLLPGEGRLLLLQIGTVSFHHLQGIVLKEVVKQLFADLQTLTWAKSYTK